MRISISSRYVEGEVVVRFHRYGGNPRRPAITLVTPTGEAIAKLTVHMPSAGLEKDEVLIKTWAENEGLLEELVGAGVLELVGRMVPCGYGDAQVCRLTDRAKEARDEQGAHD